MRNNDEDFIVFLFASLITHMIFGYIFYFGIPGLKFEREVEKIIHLEMAPIGKNTNLPDKQKKENVKQAEQAKEVKKSAQQKEVEPPAPTPKEEKKKEEVEQPVKKTDSKKPEVVQEQKQKPQETSLKPKKQEKKKPNKKHDKKDVDDFEDLLKNLQKESEAKDNKTDSQIKSQTGQDDKDLRNPSFDPNSRLSLSEKDAIRKQLEEAWNIPIGIQDVDTLKVTFYIELNSDASVSKVKLIDKQCAGVPLPTCQSFVDSAETAIFAASPLDHLSPARYNEWKTFEFTFAPQQ